MKLTASSNQSITSNVISGLAAGDGLRSLTATSPAGTASRGLRRHSPNAGRRLNRLVPCSRALNVTGEPNL